MPCHIFWPTDVTEAYSQAKEFRPNRRFQQTGREERPGLDSLDSLDVSVEHLGTSEEHLTTNASKAYTKLIEKARSSFNETRKDFSSPHIYV